MPHARAVPSRDPASIGRLVVRSLGAPEWWPDMAAGAAAAAPGSQRSSSSSWARLEAAMLTAVAQIRLAVQDASAAAFITCPAGARCCGWLSWLLAPTHSCTWHREAHRHAGTDHHTHSRPVQCVVPGAAAAPGGRRAVRAGPGGQHRPVPPAARRQQVGVRLCALCRCVPSSTAQRQ
jgi:hypothetical protein